MDPTQITIIAISIALTILIIVLGVQVFYILKEIRLSFRKMNKMLDDATRVSGAVSEGIVGMSGFMNGLKTGITAVTNLLHKGEKDE